MKILTPIHEQVLALIAAGSTISDAAESAGIHRNTIYNWLRSDPRFRCALAGAREAKALYWREQAEQLAAGALDTIRALMTDPAVPASVRLKAAQSILNIVTVPPLESFQTYAPAPEPMHNSAQSAEPETQPEPEPVHNSAQLLDEAVRSGLPEGIRKPDVPSNGLLCSAAPCRPFRRDTPKIGRNEACPCGSGRKYKHCCLEKDAQAA